MRQIIQSSRFFSTSFKRHKTDIAVVGAGAGGTAVSAQLRRALDKKVTLIEPSTYHDYQPGYTCIAGQLWGRPQKFKTSFGEKRYRRKTEDVIPKGVEHLRLFASEFFPEENKIQLNFTQELEYEYLVLALGVNLNYNVVPGMIEALIDQDHPVVSIFDLENAVKASHHIHYFKGGNAIFTQPTTPFKCAPQKILYLADYYWDRNRIRNEEYLNIPQKSVFGSQQYAEALTKICEEREIYINLEHKLVNIDHANQEATFETKHGDVKQQYDFMHVVPDHEPYSQLKPFADENEGFVDVDAETLQHKKYSNVFALGDCTNIARSKTAASAFSQAPVVVHNIAQLVEAGEIKRKAKFNGYSACPIYLGGGKLMLAEYRFDGSSDSTFFKNQAYASGFFYRWASQLFSRIYFNLMPTGFWFGRDGIFKPKF